MAAALGLALGLSAVPSDSYACNTGFKHQEPEVPCGGGAGGGDSGKSTPLTVEITGGGTSTGDAFDAEFYEDGFGGVKAGTGGETQTNAPGIGLDLKGKGPKPTGKGTLLFSCTNHGDDDDGHPLHTFIGGETGCDDFRDDVLVMERDGTFDNGNGEAHTRAELKLQARPYELFCPEAGGDQFFDCLDVFDMGTGAGNSVQMVFQVNLYEQILIELASATLWGALPLTGTVVKGREGVDQRHEKCSRCSSDFNVAKKLAPTAHRWLGV